MAKRITPKQKEWGLLEKRISRLTAKGYTPTKEFNYNKLTAKDINELRGKKLQGYFEYVNPDTGEVNTIDEHKQQTKELGFEIPQEDTVGSFDVFDRVVSLIDSFDERIAFRTSSGWREGEINKEGLKGAFYDAYNYYDDETGEGLSKYADELMKVEESLATELQATHQASDEDQLLVHLRNIINMISGGYPLNQTMLSSINDLYEVN